VVAKRIAIIGGGFCGVALAAHVLAQSSGHEVVLVDPARRVGGTAYGDADRAPLLNAGAGAMSAIAGDEHHFLRFAQGRAPEVHAASFVPRALYGDYLASLLPDAASGPSWARVQARAVALAPLRGRGLRVLLDDGGAIDSACVVLAVGNAAPRWPAGVAVAQGAHPRLIGNPWDRARLAAIEDTAPVAILGSGLTAVETCLALLEANPDRPVALLSRSGLVPGAHAGNPARPRPHLAPDDACRASARALLRFLRRASAQRARQDWPGVIDAIRPLVPAIWEGWPARERARFVRRLQPFWNVHRHRLPADALAQFERARARGNVVVHAGRCRAIDVSARRATLLFEPRGAGRIVREHAAYLVNCTGPDGDVARSADPLVASLAGAGMLVADALGLGVRVNAAFQPLDRSGQPTPGLFYLGPLLKARYWEATAVPELRELARRLAADLVARPD
jgi:uncharacterized NAD(P)/FAD-binding protein YdhS